MGPFQENDLISILVVLIKCFWQLLGFFFVLCSFYLFLIIGISLKKGWILKRKIMLSSFCNVGLVIPWLKYFNDWVDKFGGLDAGSWIYTIPILNSMGNWKMVNFSFCFENTAIFSSNSIHNLVVILLDFMNVFRTSLKVKLTFLNFLWSICYFYNRLKKIPNFWSSSNF